MRKRLGPWREALALPDGRRVVLRPIEPADAHALQVGFATISPEDVRMRFMHPMTELTPELAAQMASPDPRREFALVLAEDAPPGEALIGAVARASISSAGDEAEFALFVARPVRGQGLGAYMLRKLVDWARRKHMAAIYGNVSNDNAAMLNLAEQMGFVRAHLVGEQGVMRVVKTFRRARKKRRRS